MLSAKISSKGQIVLPKLIRDKLNIKTGTYFDIRLENDLIILHPKKKKPIDNLFGKFSGESILDELEKDHSDEISNEYRT